MAYYYPQSSLSDTSHPLHVTGHAIPTYTASSVRRLVTVLAKLASSTGVENIRENSNGGFSGTIIEQMSWKEFKLRNQLMKFYHEVIERKSSQADSSQHHHKNLNCLALYVPSVFHVNYSC